MILIMVMVMVIMVIMVMMLAITVPSKLLLNRALLTKYFENVSSDICILLDRIAADA